MATRVRIDTSLWENPRWTAMPSGAQLFALTCKTLGSNGTVTPERIVEITGWGEEFIAAMTREVVEAGFAAFLQNKRRPLPAKVRRQVMERDGPECRWCGSVENPHIDHIHPVAKGGTDDLDNLQVLCRTCNLRKGARIGLVQSR